MPSFYALEAVRAAEGRLPDFAEFARRAETATTARLGWPAPPNPTEAIDDAEHDLAILDRLVALPGESAGAARYLITANPWLARALRTRYQRWSRSWTSADGLTSRSDVVRAIMARHMLRARSYSPTALQSYACCPYRFFLQAIHGLAPREVPEAIDELDPLQRGSLIHDVQFRLFARLREEHLLPVRASNLDQAWRNLDTVIAEVAALYRDDLAPAIDRVWEDGVAAIRADLREWLRRASEDDSGYVPWHFELSFGLEHQRERRESDPQSAPGAVDLDCGIRLRGSIDLLERSPARRVRVTDHKTGKADCKAGQIIDGGQSLQPLLYALADEAFEGWFQRTLADPPRPYGDYGRIVDWRISESFPDAVGAFIAWLLNESGWKVEEEGGTVAIRPRHIAILFRRFRNFGTDVTRAYVRALEARRIPHVRYSVWLFLTPNAYHDLPFC